MFAYSLILFALLFVAEGLYIAFARHRHVGAHRPESYFVPVGGGIIFLPGALLTLFAEPAAAQIYYVLGGGAVLAAVSFADDIRGLSPGLRLAVQFAVVGIVLHPLLEEGIYDIYILALLGIVGYMNSSNFMDGINGMLAAYTFVAAATLHYYISSHTPAQGQWPLLVDDLRPMLTGLCVAVAVFAIFNCRRRAMVYAGDVGSITAGYLIAFTLTATAIVDHSPSALIIVGVYLVDTFCTFLQRLFNGENVLRPHRRHLYQILVRRGANPLAVSGAYAGTQLAVNMGWLATPPAFRNVYAIIAALILLCAYISLKIRK